MFHGRECPRESEPTLLHIFSSLTSAPSLVTACPSWGEKGSIFISSGTLGAFGYVFSDFGKAFTVRDLNGEAPTSRIITDVSV